MPKFVFTVYDSKAQAHGTLMLFNTAAEAIRSFTQAAQDPKTQIFANPGDFSLVQIGVFDEFQGSIEPLEVRVDLGTAKQLVAPAAPSVEAKQGEQAA
jgi:hypothetical protein